MTLMAIQSITRRGITPTYAAVAATDAFLPTESTFLHVKNGGGSSDTIVIPVSGNFWPGLRLSDLSIACPNGQERMIGPLPAQFFADPVTGLATVTHSFTTSVTAAAFKLIYAAPDPTVILTLAQEILADSPRGYWKLDDTTTTVADSSGNGHNGTAQANVGLGGLGLGNARGKAMWVNNAGTNGTVTVGAHADFNVVDVFTLEACIRIRQDYNNLTPQFFGASTDNGPMMKIGPGGGNFVALNKSNIAILTQSNSEILDTHLWHHVVITKNGSAQHIWIDGVDVTGTLVAFTFPSQSNAISIFSVAGRFSLCHCAIYNTELSAARVGAHYAAFRAENTPAKTSVKYGLHANSLYNSSLGLIDSQAHTAQAISAKLSRSTLNWSTIQPSNGGAYDWSRADEYVRICNIYGVTPFWVAASSPQWAHGGGAVDYDIPGVGADATFQAWVTKYQTFITDFVNRYKPGGSGPYTVTDLWLELWNEPNLQGTSGNDANGFWNNISANTTQQKADQYAYFYRNVRATILANYASTKVVMGGLSSWGGVGGTSTIGETFLRDVVGSASWSAAPIDYAAYHPYTHLDDPNSTTSFDNHFNDVILMIDVLKQLGYTSPLCLTEFGVDGSNQSTQNTNLTTMLSRIRDEWSGLCPVSIWFRDYDAFGSAAGLYTTMPTDGTASVASKTAAATFKGFASA
jgi:hypothetical protein